MAREGAWWKERRRFFFLHPCFRNSIALGEVVLWSLLPNGAEGHRNERPGSDDIRAKHSGSEDSLCRGGRPFRDNGTPQLSLCELDPKLVRPALPSRSTGGGYVFDD